MFRLFLPRSQNHHPFQYRGVNKIIIESPVFSVLNGIFNTLQDTKIAAIKAYALFNLLVFVYTVTTSRKSTLSKSESKVAIFFMS